jgi:DNA primase catalytic subunit
MIPINVSLDYYKRKEIQQALVDNSSDREVASKFNDKFSKRPDILRHANDVLEMAKQGATSFHVSEELWRNPLQLDTSLKRHDLDKLRIGWDLIIDIDCTVFDYCKIAADLVIKAFKFHNVKSISIKFSGNKGFHIGIPYSAFPDKIRDQETKDMFPQAPKKIAIYIKNMILEEFGNRIMNFENKDFNKVLEKTKKTAKEVIIIENGQKKFNPDPILQMDTLLISSRHMYRMPYSLHEKSGLASIPIDPDKVLEFKKDIAIPKKVTISKFIFLDKSNTEKNEGNQLLREGLDFSIRQDEINLYGHKEYVGPNEALPEAWFPPCIKLILQGIGDGRKRALFILVNFFTSVGWDYDKIEKRLKEWNEKNKDPLRDALLLGQVRYHKQMKKNILPPNCNNEIYMKGIGVCKPDNFCPRIKNPAQYVTKKAWLMNNQNKTKKKSENKKASKEKENNA